MGIVIYECVNSLQYCGLADIVFTQMQATG